MKHLFFLMLSAVVLSFSACQEADSCTDKLCPTNAVCDDGQCACETGYELNIDGLCIAVDNCDGVTCQNGTCVNGACDCDRGYSLDTDGDCTIEWRDAFIGGWNATNTCASGSYVAIIDNANNPDTWVIRLNNFDNDIATIYASMPSADEFEIEPDNYYSSSRGYNVYIESIGTAALNSTGTSFTFTYKVTDAMLNTSTTCTATWTK